MKVTAIIEANTKKDLYSIYLIEDIDERVGIHGFGRTPEEAIQDFWLAYDELNEMVGGDLPELNVTFKHCY